MPEKLHLDSIELFVDILECKQKIIENRIKIAQYHGVPHHDTAKKLRRIRLACAVIKRECGGGL